MEKFVIKSKQKNDYGKDDDTNNISDTESITMSDDEQDIDSIDDSEDYSNNGIKDAVDPLTFFTSKELCYYKTIHKFFKKCSDKEIIRMLDIINSDSTISLRVLDWFVTRYSKRKIDFGDNEQNTLDSFDVHISYKSELKSYKKRYFDPFRRRKKFYYPLYLNEANKYTNKNCSDSNNSKDLILLYTTLGQLNFFMWAITNRIIDYVEKNLDQVSKAMNTNNKDEKKKKQKVSTIKKKTKNLDVVQEKTKLKKDKEEKKKNTNNVFNDYYESDNESQLILNFD